MYVLKMDLPTGIAYFTGKKKVVQGCESPGLTGNIEGARFFMDEEEAAKFCKMLVKKYDMEFYYSIEEQKKRIFAQINTNGVHVKRLVNSNRNLVFRYTYRQTGKTIEILFTTDELRG